MVLLTRLCSRMRFTCQLLRNRNYLSTCTLINLAYYCELVMTFPDLLLLSPITAVYFRWKVMPHFLAWRQFTSHILVLTLGLLGQKLTNERSSVFVFSDKWRAHMVDDSWRICNEHSGIWKRSLRVTVDRGLDAFQTFGMRLDVWGNKKNCLKNSFALNFFSL